jgi:8-oxo-dGTP diphosphatase
MTEPLRTIAVAVVVHDGRVLVGRRSRDAAEAPGLAEFPGGKVEERETAAEAAARECLEEAGISIEVGSRSFGVASTQVRPNILLSFHWARPIDPAAVPKPPFMWIPIEQLPTLDFPAANAAILAMLAHDHGGS